MHTYVKYKYLKIVIKYSNRVNVLEYIPSLITSAIIPLFVE